MRARLFMSSKLPCPASLCPSSVVAARKYSIKKTRIAAVKEVFGFFRTDTSEHMS